MIERTVMDYLEESLQTECRTERPEDPPARYILVEKLPSTIREHISISRIALQCYAPTLYEAAELSTRAKIAMLEMISLDDIAAVGLESEYNFTNPVDKQPRYQAVFEITHYEEGV